MSEPSPEQSKPPVSDRLLTMAEGLGFRESSEMKKLGKEITEPNNPRRSIDEAARTQMIFEWIDLGNELVRLHTMMDPEEHTSLQIGFQLATTALYSKNEMTDVAKNILLEALFQAKKAGKDKLAAQITTILLTDFNYSPNKDDISK